MRNHLDRVFEREWGYDGIANAPHALSRTPKSYQVKLDPTGGLHLDVDLWPVCFCKDDRRDGQARNDKD